MGTALYFLEAARAYKVALTLLDLGAGVLWDPKQPETVMTSMSRDEARRIIKEHPGVAEDWYKTDKIDVDIRRGGG